MHTLARQPPQSGIAPGRGVGIRADEMGRIPEATVEQVLASTDIVELVGRYVKLRRSGANFVGLCPFHNEKSPSFNVSPSRNSYHCFGCGAGGTAIGFVMDHDGLTFVEAVKRLADAAGIRLEEEVWDANAEKEAKLRAGLIKVHQKLAEWYHQLLLRDPTADPARQYLKSRAINSAIAKNWQLGYAPGSGDALRRWAQSQGFNERQLVAAGVLVENERGETYPRFRQRLMFPICNDNGEVIAFSGRLLQADAKAAKYLNSPETPIFSKSRVLFGFHKARRAIAKAAQAIVCEGQIDLVMAFEAGFENVAAALGTAFTEHHAKLLKRHADEVVLCYDSDAAGFKAAQRAFQILAPTGLIVRVASLPAGDDPDTLIRREGRAAFAGLIERAQEFIDCQIAHAAAQPKFGEMTERVRFAEQMAGNIRLLENPVARATAIQRVAARLGIPEDGIRKRVGAASRPQNQPAAAETRTREVADYLATQNRYSIELCEAALRDPVLLLELRRLFQDDALLAASQLDLIRTLTCGDFDPHNPAAFGAFRARLDPLQDAAFSRLQAGARHSPPIGSPQEIAEAFCLACLTERLSEIDTRKKAPGLPVEEIVRLGEEQIRLKAELQARRAQVQSRSVQG